MYPSRPVVRPDSPSLRFRQRSKCSQELSDSQFFMLLKKGLSKVLNCPPLEVLLMHIANVRGTTADASSRYFDKIYVVRACCRKQVGW